MKQPQINPDTKQAKAFFSPAIYAVFVIGLLFFLYNAARAWFVAITHDEAFTFNEYVRAPLWEILRVQGSNSNNHLLNTLAIKLFYNLFGNHWFIIRFHSVLLYGVYLFFGYKLLRFVKNDLLLICGFILLSTNPFLFDFFSLARGYLPALACTLASLYYAIRFINSTQEKEQSNNLWKALIIGALTVIFHLSFLNYFVPLCGLLLLYMAWPKNASGFKWKLVFRKSWPVFLVLTLVIAYALPVSLWIKSLGEMELAGKTGFWVDTVQSLIYYSFYDQHYESEWNIWLISTIVAVFLALAALIILIKIALKSSLHTALGFVGFLLVMIFLCIYFQHIILDNPFPNVRLALFFVPLFSLLIIYSLNEINKFYVGTVIAICLTGFMIFHFVKSVNLYKTMNWAADADTYEMLSALKTEKDNSKTEKPLRLGTFWIDEPNINYYRIQGKKYWLGNITREGFLPNDEYFYSSPEMFKQFNKEAVKIIKIFPRTGNILAQNLWADSLPLIAEKQLNLGGQAVHLERDASSGIIVFKRNEIRADSILVVGNIWVQANHDYVGGSFVIASDSLADNQNIWRSVKISDGIIESGKWQQISFSTILSLKNAPQAAVKSYIWNTGKIPLELKHLDIKLFDLTKAKPIYRVNE